VASVTSELGTYPGPTANSTQSLAPRAPAHCPPAALRSLNDCFQSIAKNPTSTGEGTAIDGGSCGWLGERWGRGGRQAGPKGSKEQL
jgi:hypothetical protein